ncbi:MAG: branched-chain amino acid ABC transporter permease, partial [Candidatus Competibacterales bacterium]
MDATLLSVQLLNGLQWGVLLFLIAAGLTLVFGLMDFINLAHGVQYVLGAYLCAAFLGLVGDFFAAEPLALGVSLGVGWLLERLVLRKLYGRDHLYHVLATVGLIYFITEGIEILFGNALIAVEVPPLLHGEIPITAHFNYSLWRVAVIVVGLGVALALWWGATPTRVGQLVRAGAHHPPMVAALGVDVQRMNAGV